MKFHNGGSRRMPLQLLQGQLSPGANVVSMIHLQPPGRSMRAGLVIFVGLFMALPAACCCAAAHNKPPSSVHLAIDTRAIFAAKCVQCHGSNLSRPKGKFGYVLNLRQLADNPDLVVPFNPGKSKLWQQIEDDEMPPEDARAGPLNDAEKAVIRWWIEAGAASGNESAVEAKNPGHLDSGTNLWRRLLRWVGRFHVLVVHFPIALLAAAALAESWWRWRGRFGMSPAVRYCVLIGAAGAIAAAALGWVRAPFSGYGPSAADTLLLHRWIGTAAAAIAVAAAFASEGDVLRGRRSRVFQIVLFTTALLIGAAGHFGGTLVWGQGYFNW